MIDWDNTHLGTMVETHRDDDLGVLVPELGRLADVQQGAATLAVPFPKRNVPAHDLRCHVAVVGNPSLPVAFQDLHRRCSTFQTALASQNSDQSSQIQDIILHDACWLQRSTH